MESTRGKGVLAALALLVAGLSSGSSHASGVLRIEVLSNRADLISGGDALVQVDLPSGVSASDVTVKLGATDVTEQFGLRSNGKYQGLLTGLALGPNVLKALLPGGSGAQITITNHPRGGPVFSGPQVQPWTCNAGATSPQCDRPASYQFLYMPAGAGNVPYFFGAPNGLLPYDPANPPPAALIAQTTTDQGKTVPFIVRVETGSVDRGQSKIAVLFDPAKGWAPWAPQDGWNHKLFVPGGAGCGLSYTEGSAGGSVLDNLALSRGFATLRPELINSGHTCHMPVQAESLMMAKEHFIETYGPIRYTLAWGVSGGAIFQHQVANGYPGLLDGLIPEVGFQGGWALARQSSDCDLLFRYLEDPTSWAPGVVWTSPQMAMVGGQGAGLQTTCGGPGISYRAWAAGLFGPSGAPADAYDAQSNPGGVRASLQDYGVAVMGRRPPEVWTAAEKAIGRGFGNRPLDNVGVAYGFEALKSGVITPAQFIDLNAKVGGRDIDWNWHPERDEADPAAIANAYRSGLDNTATNLDQVAIIDIESVTAKAEVHDVWRAWSMRALLDKAHGTHANQVIWSDWSGSADVQSPPLNTEAFLLMDRWLSAIEADTSNLSRAHKVIANKPADAVDRCTARAGLVENDQLCYGAWEQQSPRMAAGGPLTDDITKCQLQPLDASDLIASVPFSASQFEQLQQIFPSGVCDYSKPGVAQVPTSSWLTYQDDGVGGGAPLGAAPVSTAI